MLPVAGLTVTCSIPGMAANVSLTVFKSSGLPFPAGIFIRTRPGTWCSILRFIFVMERTQLKIRAGAASLLLIDPHLSAGRQIYAGLSIRTSLVHRRFRLLHVALGMHLGNDVMDLLLRLGPHLARLVAELVGATYRGPEQRVQRFAHFRKVLRRP